MALIPRPRPAGLPWADPPASAPGPRLHRPSETFRAECPGPGSAPGPDALDALRADWERGRRTPAEAFLGRLDPADTEAIIELIYGEFYLAQEHGLAPEPRDYLARFPAHRDRLAGLFDLHEALDSTLLELFRTADADAGGRLPGPGEDVGPYRLLRELGRGGFARVFLAAEPRLEGRLVVVKVSARPSPEPRLLARASHPGIVAIVCHQEASRGLHLTCMPFQGGADLGTVLAALPRRGRRRRPGRALVEALDRVGAPEYPPPAGEAPARDLLAALRLDAAAAWVVARLAQALDHAHGRGVSHGDLKPSNVLLAADGRPLLLDFNLACDWRRDAAAREGSDPGGTVAYMPPERLCALAGADAGGFPDARARHRADLYALGLILAEALGVRLPPARLTPGRLDSAELLALAADRTDGDRFRQALLPAVPAGLRPILAHLLAPDPADRYPRAAELAEDLDRYRMGLAPAHAPALGWLDALQARARRARRAALVGAVAAAVLVPAGLVAEDLRARQHRTAALALDEAIYDQPGLAPLRTRLLRSARRTEASEPVGAYGERLRHLGVYGSAGWLEAGHAAWLPEARRADLQLVAAEQAWHLARGVLRDAVLRREAPGAWADAAREALTALRHVGGDAMPVALRPLADELAEALHDPAPRPDRPAPAWLDAYLAGVEASATRPRVAAAAFGRCLAAQPGSFRARCARVAAHTYAGDLDAALDDLDRCIGLRPRHADLYALKAGILLARRRPGDIPEAVRLLDIAEALGGASEATLANYREVRLALRQLQQAYEAAVRADARGGGPGAGHLVRLAARRDEIADDDPGRVADLLDALDDEARAAYFRGFCLYELGRFEDALAAFEAADRLDPADPRAAHARVAVLRKLGRPSAGAVRALVDHPGFPAFVAEDVSAARVYKLLAADQWKANDFDAALRTLDRGLAALDGAAAPDEAAAPYRAELLYAAARVALVRGLSTDAQVALVRDRLLRARAAAPAAVDAWLARDRAFDGVRDRLDAPGPR
jgi:serine/threonine protein kinase